MSRCSCCLFAIIFLAIIIADVFLFIFLLRQYEMNETKVTSTDMVTVDDDDNISTFWCRGVNLQSSNNFDAYEGYGKPYVRQGYYEKYSNDLEIPLSNFESRLYELYLLEGSTMHISACATEPSALIAVFADGNDLKKCVEKRSKNKDDYDDDDLECSGTIRKSKIYVESDCDGHGGWSWHRRRREMDLTAVNVYESSRYYILVQNFYHLSRNVVKMQLNLSRTVFDERDSERRCIGTDSCHLALDFMSDIHIVAKMLPSETSSSQLTPAVLLSECELNIIVLISVFLGVPLILVLFMCCLCFCSRKRKRSEKESKEYPKEPLLKSNQCRHESEAPGYDNKSYGTVPYQPAYGNPPMPQPEYNKVASGSNIPEMPTAPNLPPYSPPQYQFAQHPAGNQNQNLPPYTEATNSNDQAQPYPYKV